MRIGGCAACLRRYSARFGVAWFLRFVGGERNKEYYCPLRTLDVRRSVRIVRFYAVALHHASRYDHLACPRYTGLFFSEWVAVTLGLATSVAILVVLRVAARRRRPSAPS